MNNQKEQSELYSYINGPFTTTIYSDGTKIRVGDGMADFPENIDIKITNYCDAGCARCHEKSTMQGKHGDLKWLTKELIATLPKGAELAIGGGNPLDHPELIRFVKTLKNNGLIPNVTVNSLHYNSISQELLDNIYGLGLSYVPGITEKIAPKENTVIHTIAGVHKPQSILNLVERGHKVLILGYKTYGRGEAFYSEQVKKNINELRLFMHNILGKGLVSFDNLALEQLEIHRHYTKQTFAERFMGDEGTFTMYIDAVTSEYGIASSLPRRYPLQNIILAFKHIQNDYKKRMSIRNK